MGQGVQVEVRAPDGERVRSQSGLDHLGRGQMWGRRGLGELGGELAEGQVLAAPPDEAEGRRVPESGGPAVAEKDLVAHREAEQLTQPLPEAPYDRPYACLAVARAQVGRRSPGQGLHGLRADLGRTAPEAAVTRQQVRRDLDGGGA